MNMIKKKITLHTVRSPRGTTVAFPVAQPVGVVPSRFPVAKFDPVLREFVTVR